MIRLQGVHKRFKAPVLDALDLHVPSGLIYALIGPGAAGKSLIFRLICGLMKPDAGQIFVGNEEVSRLSELELGEVRKSIGMLFQNYALFDASVFENIAFPLRQLGTVDENEMKERVAERLRRVALPGTEERDPSSMSGGQKKRIGIARATIGKAPILLYDEPVAGLDPVTSQKIYNLIHEEQRAQGSTVLVISSDVSGVLTIADRVGMLHEGRLVFDGSVAEARSSNVPAVRQFVHGLTEGPL